jgi:hypothetical protein
MVVSFCSDSVLATSNGLLHAAVFSGVYMSLNMLLTFNDIPSLVRSSRHSQVDRDAGRQPAIHQPT